ncbi:uncharacterized protein LOC103513782 [Diaphorina citri]|uniref:Uncharacterized protein LOC103513782 n=1 Tax=Diaphorina citri TaxID=121845 RepID=A0A3Q0J2Q1_DIACI|nr:uncharacterized protein LOC103513782 [Diaphorina citri]
MHLSRQIFITRGFYAFLGINKVSTFFFSYILQARFIRPAINNTYDPGMMYYFLSTVADVSANPHINASAIYFAPNMSYSPSYRGFFNKTMPRFAPRTFRADDFNDPIHLERISTLNTFIVRDLGSIPNGSLSSDYTSDFYRINEWYTKWLPDKVEKRHDTKTTYQVEIRYSNNTNETFVFHGPPGADEVPGPVKWTRPYFDCGRSNKWLVAAVVPIADIYPRHTTFRHIEYPTYTAVAVLEMDFDRIDINQCPAGEGNSGPNRFADTARCKKETTECEPLHGWGFRRGGYQCRCIPGFRLPNVVRRPYLGEIIERATSKQYYNGFDCSKIGWVQKMPVQWEKAKPEIREKYMDMYYEYRNFTPGPGSLHTEKINIEEVLKFLFSVNAESCKKYSKQDLELQGDFAFGAEEQFANEAKMAVRLANFISAFLQISDPKEVYSGKRLTDQPLSEDQMIGETLALALGDSKIWSAGMYWDRNKFTNRTLFAPFAYKEQLNTRKFKVEDLARLNKTEEVYTNAGFFQFLKQRWSTNFDSLEKFYMKIKIRFNETGEYLKKYEHYPNFYRAATLDDGYWTSPYFDCDGKLKKWVITYAVPFFGWDSLKVKLEFKAVLERTGYSLDVTTGQRKYGGPPPNWQGPAPGVGCEVFCGKIPRDVYEDELIVLFEKCGTIYDLRLMMDPLSGTNRGYAFVTYTSRDQADVATRELDNYEIKPGKTLKVNISVPNLRLFVGNIPKSKSREEIFEEFNKLTKEVYTNAGFFQFLKQRWSTNFDSLEKFYMKIKIRFNETGEYLKKYEHYPNFYRAATLDDGYWTSPYFDCDGKLKKWVITYAVPFFGWDSLKVKLEFNDYFNEDYYYPNAGGETEDPYLDVHSYGDVAKVENAITYYDGQLVEAEFTNLVVNTQTRFDMFQCRIAGAASIYSSMILNLTLLVLVYLVLKHPYMNKMTTLPISSTKSKMQSNILTLTSSKK